MAISLQIWWWGRRNMEIDIYVLRHLVTMLFYLVLLELVVWICYFAGLYSIMSI